MGNSTSQFNFDFISFNKKLQSDFNEANKFKKLVCDFTYHSLYHPVFDYEIEFEKQQFATYLKSIKLKLIFAFEFFKLKLLLRKFMQEIGEFESDLAKLAYESEFDYLHSPVLTILNNYFDVFSSCIPAVGQNSNKDEFDLLEQILHGTAKILSDREILPSNESEVRKAVYDMLVHIYPDTVREIPIAKVSKTYKPDIGIKKLKCAIEYKFVDSLEEAKTSIGGIFEDVAGYAGSADWCHFYAVIYMTDHFLTQYQIAEEFKLSNISSTWKPILIYGKGARVKKQQVPAKKL